MLCGCIAQLHHCTKHKHCKTLCLYVLYVHLEGIKFIAGLLYVSCCREKAAALFVLKDYLSLELHFCRCLEAVDAHGGLPWGWGHLEKCSDSSRIRYNKNIKGKYFSSSANAKCQLFCSISVNDFYLNWSVISSIWWRRFLLMAAQF